MAGSDYCCRYDMGLDVNPDFGIINYLLLKVGLISEKINFLGDSRYAMATVIFVNILEIFPVLYNFIPVCNAVYSSRFE